jgi:hypothetical protein
LNASVCQVLVKFQTVLRPARALRLNEAKSNADDGAYCNSARGDQKKQPPQAGFLLISTSRFIAYVMVVSSRSPSVKSGAGGMVDSGNAAGNASDRRFRHSRIRRRHDDRMDSRKAEGMRFTINLITPDNGEKFIVELENATLTNFKGFLADKPDLTLTIKRSDLEQTMMGQKSSKLRSRTGPRKWKVT